MVESHQDQDDPQNYGRMEDEEAELPTYLTSDYLDQCVLYQSGDSNEENDSNYRGNSSNGCSRPVSRLIFN